MKTRLALIDADSMIYIVAYKFKDKKVANLVKISLDTFISECLNAVDATHYIGFYGSKEVGAESNFRYQIDSEYKSTRPPSPDFIEKWRPVIHQQMKERWGFMPIEGMESDDAVAIANKEFKGQYDSIVIITSDKDLKQIPNTTHFDMGKRVFTEINQFDADKFFCEQMLKGDPGDAIKGLPGIGPKKAADIVNTCTTSTQLKWIVMRMYREHFDNELTKLIAAETKTLSADWLAENEVPLTTKGYTTKQIARKLNIAMEAKIDSIKENHALLNWRTYLIQQYRLLRMLETAPDGFKLIDVLPYTGAPQRKTTIDDIIGL